MKISKVQMELLKSAFKGTVDVGRAWVYSEDDENVYLIQDGHRIAVIPKCVYWLDNTKLFHGREPMHMDSFKKASEESGTVRYTGNSKHLADGRDVEIFEGDGFEAWVSTKLLDIFDLRNSTFKCKNALDILYIFEGGAWVGAVCPTRHE